MGVCLATRLIDDTYRVTADVKFPSMPIDLAVIGTTAEVAVVLPSDRMLQCVDTGTSPPTLTRIIACDRVPAAVAAISNTELAVGWEEGFDIIDLLVGGREKLFLGTDTTGRQIRFDCLDLVVDVSRSRVYQASESEDAVYAFGFTGEPHFTYTHDQLLTPRGIALDRDMNLYICSYGADTVHQVSPDGALIRVIDPGLICSCTLGFDDTGHHLYVTDGGSKNGRALKFVP